MILNTGVLTRRRKVTTENFYTFGTAKNSTKCTTSKTTGCKGEKEDATK